MEHLIGLVLTALFAWVLGLFRRQVWIDAKNYVEPPLQVAIRQNFGAPGYNPRRRILFFAMMAMCVNLSPLLMK